MRNSTTISFRPGTARADARARARLLVVVVLKRNARTAYHRAVVRHLLQRYCHQYKNVPRVAGHLQGSRSRTMLLHLSLTRAMRALSTRWRKITGRVFPRSGQLISLMASVVVEGSLL